MPSFVHRCPMSLIVHGDMMPGLHPLGVKVDSLFVPGRCHGQDIGCKAALLHEAPPQANEYIMNRLKSDVKGLFTRNTFHNNNEQEESTSDQQQVVFPKEIQDNLVNNNKNNDEPQNKEEKDDSSSSSSFYPLASEEILGLNNQSYQPGLLDSRLRFLLQGCPPHQNETPAGLPSEASHLPHNEHSSVHDLKRQTF